MNRIRNRFLLLTAICTSIYLGFGTLALGTLAQAYSIAEQMQISARIGYISSQIQRLPESAALIKELKSLSVDIKPEFRQSALERYLKSPSRYRWNYVLETEDRIQSNLAQSHKYLIDRAKYHGIIALCAGVMLSIFGFIYLINKIFKPLSSLDGRMDDFLANRYSYEFAVPDENEIGELHSSFNALAQKVLSQIDDLKSLDKAKSEFLSIASHELRTPLTSIKGSLSLLRAGVVENLNAKTKDLLSIALNETDRLIRLINELLDLAKIEAKKFPLNLEWNSLDELLDKSIQSIDGLAKTAQVKLVKDIPKPLLANIDCDRIQQVITNLMSNAIKFSPAKSKVTLRATVRADNLVLIEVIDQGHGIAPEDQALIFEKFRQATSEKNPLVKGTGLGLAIARALVEQHGGEIGVSSIPNQGSTFWFTLTDFKYDTEQARKASA